jgi:glutamine amidotransferase
MSAKTIHIIDYGSSNLLSIARAFEHIGAKVVMVQKASDISNADHLVLPGVGAFPDGMEALVNAGFDKAIHQHATAGKPLLGICLGMQLLLDIGTEMHEVKGLELIPGKVLALPKDQAHLKVPNINWHPVSQLSDHPLFNSIPNNEMFYFVHSYYAQTNFIENNIGQTAFGSLMLSSVIAKNNIMGTQFHPEKSGEMGLQLLRNFIRLT